MAVSIPRCGTNGTPSFDALLAELEGAPIDQRHLHRSSTKPKHRVVSFTLSFTIHFLGGGWGWPLSVPAFLPVRAVELQRAVQRAGRPPGQEFAQLGLVAKCGNTKTRAEGNSRPCGRSVRFRAAGRVPGTSRGN